MKTLNVPHIRQVGVTHCGVACLEMVYRYFGIENIKQEDIWLKRKSRRPDGTRDFMRTQSMLDDLLENDFKVLVGQISLDYKECLGSLERLLSFKLPIIANKQWRSDSAYGHFVVIVGLVSEEVIFLDPELDNKLQQKPLTKFIEEWRTTGDEVVGGQFIVMGRAPHELMVNHLYLTKLRIQAVSKKSFCLNDLEF